MATLLLPPGRSCASVVTEATATLVSVISPVRSASGQLRVIREEIPAGGFLAEVIPSTQPWARVVLNGTVIAGEQQSVLPIAPGDEVWLWPQWGLDPFTGGLLLTIGIGLLVSIATTALSYVLFPPTKPHIATSTDEHTFSFEGIRTAIGPGQPVPIIYGTHRVGGQLLRAFVDQAMTIVDTGASVRRVTALSTPPTLNMLIALGEGPIDSILMETIELNAQPIANFPNASVEFRLGTPDQTSIAAFVEIRNTFAEGRALGFESSPITYTTTGPISGFILNIVFNEGLFNVSSKGDKEDNTVNVAYQIRLQGGGAFGPWTTFQVSAQRTAPVRIGIRREGLGGAYDINLNYGGIRHSDDLHAKWVPTLESVTEIQPGTETFPNTALLAIRAVATDALQGALPNVTAVVRGRTVRVGTFTVGSETISDNPAWCVMDFLTHKRYGLGVDDGTIDLGGFTAWAAYCNETIGGELRHNFNYVLDRDARAQALLLEMMGGSRTILLKSEGQWTARPTRNDPPVQLISWTSCTNLRLTYTRDPDRINVMEARFANEEQNFTQDVLTWPTIENWPPDVRKASMEIRGVTKPSRIMRTLQFELNRRRFENLQLTMDCALDAVVLQVHDIFRFSHPLPGWGVSGRVQVGSTPAFLGLDEDVTMIPGQTYHVYVKHNTDFTEVKPVINTGNTTRTLGLGQVLTGTPEPNVAMWAFGLTTPDTAVKLFRVVKLTRQSDATVHVEAIIHNPSITDEPEATALPITTGLFNPLGPPPSLTILLATELTRVQLNGSSMRVVNLSWDIAPLGPGFAPYAGAAIFRRTVLESGSAGMAVAGSTLAALQHDANINFMQIDQVVGHVLDWDDYSVVSGGTYVYRVVPTSRRGVPNEMGSLEVVIHVTGPTTPDFFPVTPLNLRLRGQAVGDPFFIGRDVHLQWDRPSSPLFNTTFFLQDYLVQVWAPGQLYLLRSTFTTATEFTYTLEMNTQDQLGAGQLGARRDLMFTVSARTNTGRSSLTPASITVINPPPDMSSILPEAEGFFGIGEIKWDQFAEPRDFDHYELHLDTQNPPIAIYFDIAISGTGQGLSFRRVFPQNLTPNITYYTFILPYDTFGPGIPSQVASFTPVALTADSLDITPPATPTGLTLTTGTDVSADGTIMPWVRASWTAAPEPDVAGYEVHVFVNNSLVPSVFTPGVMQNSIQFPVPGHVFVRVKLLAFDQFHNLSAFTPDASITTAGDTAPPGPVTLVTPIGSIKSIIVFWTPPSDVDYAYSEVWSALTNNRAEAVIVGTGRSDFVHDALGANDTRYYWVRAVDTSGNVSATFTPLSATDGAVATAGQLDTTYISSLAASKIITGTISAFVSIGVADRIHLDGVNDQISIFDQAGVGRVFLGKLGALAQDWGLRILNSAGQTMWTLTDGATTAGISDVSITAAKIAAATIVATHLRTDTEVVTTASQIRNAIIGDQHINNLSANKIIAGTIQAMLFLGAGGRFRMDGTNEQMQILDVFGTERIRFGRVDVGPGDYGLYIFNQNHEVMWQFNSGVSSLGIQDLAVTNAKIANAAITNAKIGNLEVDFAKIANLTVGTAKIANNAVSASLLFVGSGGGGLDTTDIEFARVTMNLNTGDQVLLIGCCETQGAGQAGAPTSLYLREDSLTGPLHHFTSAFQSGGDAGSRQALTVQSVYVAGGELPGKVFLLAGRGIAAFANVRLSALQLHK